MLQVTSHHRGDVSVAEYRCTAGPQDRPYWEAYADWSVSYVRAGSFGCHCRGRRFELVPGSVLLGRPGEEYCCSHEHRAGGDVCLAVHLIDAVVDEIAPTFRRRWQAGALPPQASWMAAGERLGAAMAGHNDLGVDEAALLFVSDVVCAADGRDDFGTAMGPRDRARVVEAALRIEARCGEDTSLQQLADEAHWSAHHFLRRFHAAVGVTPHQYLVRCRLAQAARTLVDSERPVTDIALDAGFADLSNFIRSFRRATGMSPRAWRRCARQQSKICQVPRRAAS